jgi:D-inositol-3-phosphate glycosyltransferase
MRAGKPVVASAVGGLTEMILDGVTGRLVPKEDAPALAAALTAQSKPTLQKMGHAARERFLTSYSIEKVHDSLLRLYDRVQARRSQRSPTMN